MTSHAWRVNELNALSLRSYWDGRKEPGVEVPLGEFFAVGQGKPAVVESVPVQVSPSGALSCYWRMPFDKSACAASTASMTSACVTSPSISDRDSTRVVRGDK